MNLLIESIINELAYKDLTVKQRSIDRLFPEFKGRVEDVMNKGGMRFVGYEKGGLWKFKVGSGTAPGKKYNVYVRFRDLDSLVYELAKDKRLWKRDLSGVDRRILAVEVLFQADLELYCSCPAFQYWGPAYILTRRRAKYTDPETRPPRIRNPKEYGAYCKHLEAVMEVLPMYAPDMMKYLGMYYLDKIKKAEEEMKKVDKDVRKAAEFLRAKLEEE